MEPTAPAVRAAQALFREESAAKKAGGRKGGGSGSIAEGDGRGKTWKNRDSISPSL